MITETKEVYKCEYCRRLYQLRHFCVKHETKCKKNPANFQKCFGCQYLDKIRVTHFQDTPYSDFEEKRSILYCSAKKEGVYPYWIDGLLSEDLDPEMENNPMPKECDLYE